MVCLLALPLPALAQVVPLDDPAQLSGLDETQDFESLLVGALAAEGEAVTLGTLTFTSTTGLGVVDTAAFDADGTEIESRSIQPRPSGVFGGSYGIITITPDVPVRQIILGWFDPNFSGNILRAFNTQGEVIAQAQPALGPVGGAHAAWVGLSSTKADIARVDVVPSSSGDFYSIDNVSIFVPGPGATTVLAAALGLCARRRR